MQAANKPFRIVQRDFYETTDGSLFPIEAVNDAVAYEKRFHANNELDEMIQSGFIDDGNKETILNDEAARYFVTGFMVAYSDFKASQEIEEGCGGDCGNCECQSEPATQPVSDEAIAGHIGDAVDAFYFEAVEAVRSGEINASGKAIRTKFKIGYERAKNIMDCMKADGVIPS